MTQQLRATYRLQLRKEFTFRDAADTVEYLAEMGFSHLYLSPILRAQRGSLSGYDVVDPTRLNPELGSEADFEDLVAQAQSHGMGLIIDIVPNHMGVGPDNPWWTDVLEWGEQSPYARFFDIDWEPSRQTFSGKLLLPILGDHFGRVLEAGQLGLEFDPGKGSFFATYFQHRLPISPRYYGFILAPAVDAAEESARPPLQAILNEFTGLFTHQASDERQRRRAAELKKALADLAGTNRSAAAAIKAGCARFAGTTGDLATWQPLGRLLDSQAYRLAWWRTAADDINYRRFFDISELVGLRQDAPEVFEETHRRILELVAKGRIDGLRIDHIDGLRDPAAYLRRLEGSMRAAGRPCRIYVEKILSPGEELRQDWPVLGTTGYDNLCLIDRVLVDPAGERSLSRVYRQFTRRLQDFDQVAVAGKVQVLKSSLVAEVLGLATAFNHLAEGDWRTRDFTVNTLRLALIDVLSRFSVYRTYVDERGTDATDRRTIAQAVDAAKQAAPESDSDLYDFIADTLTGELGRRCPERRDEALAAALRFQQLSGPAMAKGVEDTAYYRYFRLISANEVNGDPRRLSVSLKDFHLANLRRLESWPDDMIGGTTHDTKRGEDSRARLGCLAGMGPEWGRRVRAWSRLNRALGSRIDGRHAPERNDEYYFYQTLLGAWPATLQPDDQAGLADLADRIEGAIIKALREGKEQSSWLAPNEGYERVLVRFARGCLDPTRSAAFLRDFHAFFLRVGRLGALTSLSQTLIRLTIPGVPDTYRGAEMWELSLVDPDNRRPLDRAHIRTVFAEVRRRFSEANATVEGLAELLDGWQDGRIKLHLMWRALGLRRKLPDLFARGAYRPLRASGARASHVVAFLRSDDASKVITVAPRFWPGLTKAGNNGRADWQGTRIALPAGRYENWLVGRPFEVAPGQPVSMSELLEDFPVALLVQAAA